MILFTAFENNAEAKSMSDRVGESLDVAVKKKGNPRNGRLMTNVQHPLFLVA